MESKWKKSRNKRDLLRLLQYRETNAESCSILKQYSQFTDSLVKRLGLEYELEGHHGCVNCLQWTPDGKFLASGSDDTNVILWDPFRHKKLQIIPTHHIGNIFSVKFLGNSNNIIATAAGDCRVLVQTLPGEIDKNTPLLECSCHVNRVKRLAVSPEEPTLFWSAGEDGLVVQYDLREQHECSSQSQILVDLSYTSEVKCIAVNPTKPHYIAVGANDCYIRMYDRRMLKTSTVQEANNVGEAPKRPPDPPDPKCVHYYAAGHLAKENATSVNYKFAATHISFNTAGSEMLVNMGGEHIYLFDVNNARHINEMQVPHFQSRNIKGEPFLCCCMHEDNGYVINSNSCRLNHFQENCACYYMKKAFACYQRKWMGDLYSAARDYLYVIQHWPDHKQAYIGIIKSFIDLKWAEEAEQWMDYFCKIHQDYSDSTQIKLLRESLENLKKDFPKESREVEEHEKKMRLDSTDYELRFLGHCNTTTDIKEANFLGEDGNYICAGSDEGIIFIWERTNCTIVTALFGDESIINCIQPHPSACFIASSGIDPAVKLWSPVKEDETINHRVVKDIAAVVEANQQRMALDPFQSHDFWTNMGYRFSIESTVFQGERTCRTS